MKIQIKIAMLLFSLPLVAYAQFYNCKNGDGTNALQNYPCPAGTEFTAKDSQALTDAAYSEQQKKLGLDVNCQHDLKSATESCRPSYDVAKNQCWQRRLSSNCFDQVTALPLEKRDSSCMQELNPIMLPCVKEASSSTQQCVQKTLSPQCNRQVATYKENEEKSNADCRAKMKRALDEMGSCLKIKDQNDQKKCLDKISGSAPGCG